MPTLSLAAAPQEFTIVIKNHTFEPAELIVPANKKIKLIIDNQDSTPEEFESHSLKREKIIKGKSKGIVMLNPLKPGRYSYVGEFHEDVAKGTIVVQ